MHNIEIHSLICHKDLHMALNNLQSLQVYDNFINLPIFLHDDGSITEQDLAKLKNSLSNINFIRKDFADKAIIEYIKNYPHCMQYRLGSSHINLWHKIKLFDYFFFSQSKNILGLDSDLLFMKKPVSLIELLDANMAFYFPDVNDAYSFNEPKNITHLHRVNTGLIHIPSSDFYHLDSIEYALSNLVKNNINYFPSWIEQSAFAHMFYADSRFYSLDPEKYRIPYFQSVEINTVECLHFVSYPKTRELYSDYYMYLSLIQNCLIYDKTFIIRFNNNEVPLQIIVYCKENIFCIKFHWKLKETNQKQLSHIFKVNGKEFKFESEETNFFILKDEKTNNLTIQHTYEWYGEVCWQTLDRISIC